MPGHEPFDRCRRGLLVAGGALTFAAALRPWRALAQPTGNAKLRIGVIGSGHIGGTIGGLWVKAGHPVLFSSRHPEELKDLVAGLGPLAQAGTVAQAIAFGDVLFVAVPYGALPQIGKDNEAALKGKVVLDTCNPYVSRDGAMAQEALDKGTGVTDPVYLPGTRLVRAFSAVDATAVEASAEGRGERLAVPVAGDDRAAVDTAVQLVRDAGCEPLIVGDLAAARSFQRHGPGFRANTNLEKLRRLLGLADPA